MNNAWLSKDKFNLAPNVVKCTQRFNHVKAFACTFFIAGLILGHQRNCQGAIAEHATASPLALHQAGQGPHPRVAHSQRLMELNNLHGALAVLSGLQSAAVHRLTRMWEVGLFCCLLPAARCPMPAVLCLICNARDLMSARAQGLLA